MELNPALMVAVLVPSVILHELSHGLVASWFGDDTARRAGRLTLNPLVHVDPLGTVILPALLAIAGGGVLGYAKPVPVRPARMRRPRDHGLLTSLAGPLTNILIAVLAAGVLRATGGTATDQAGRILVATGVVNVVLAAFNLLPLPPLDGSALIGRLLPPRWLGPSGRLRPYSMILVFALAFLVPGALAWVFDAAEQLWTRLL